MTQSNLVELTMDELLNVRGGAAQYTCALLGGLTAAGYLAANPWVFVGGLIAAYANDCFSH